MPVSFINVRAYEKATNIQVDWTVGTETNIKEYEVEKSADGRSFNKAATIAATSNSTYSFTDINTVTGNNFYRIKSIGLNGEGKYSSIVNVKKGIGSGSITVYPNPVKGNVLTLQMNNQPKDTYSVRLINNAGQEVLIRSIEHQGGSATQTIPLGNLSKGVYQLKITSGHCNSVTTIILN